MPTTSVTTVSLSPPPPSTATATAGFTKASIKKDAGKHPPQTPAAASTTTGTTTTSSSTMSTRQTRKRKAAAEPDADEAEPPPPPPTSMTTTTTTSSHARNALSASTRHETAPSNEAADRARTTLSQVAQSGRTVADQIESLRKDLFALLPTPVPAAARLKQAPQNAPQRALGQSTQIVIKTARRVIDSMASMRETIQQARSQVRSATN